jgi:hypothetical protein
VNHQAEATIYTSNGHRNGNGRVSQVNGVSNSAARAVTFTVNGRKHPLNLAEVALMGPAELAILAADLRKAGWPAWLVQLVTEANPGYRSTAFHLTKWQRQLIDDGRATLSQFHNAGRKRDREVEDFLKRPGIAARVLAALDRMTAPMSVPAE